MFASDSNAKKVPDVCKVFNRRNFLKTSSAAALGAIFYQSSVQNLKANHSLYSAKHYEIVDIKRTTVRLEYREVPRRNMDRELPHWRYTEILEVKLASGVTGIGETLLYYTWGVPTDENVRKVIGKNAMSLMWDDSLGAGLQMALFDAVAKTSEVPIHAILGKQVHGKTPLSWWNIDTSAADMASECKTAKSLGYMSYKTKGRPWFDIWEQVDLAAKAVPPEFKIDMDFNSTLRTAEQGMEILKGLEKYPQIDIYESPIPQSDVEGNKKIHEATRVQIALHYGTPKPAICAKENVCDGFVVGGGATSLTRAAKFSEEASFKFWLQLVGTGITAAYSLHFGGVLKMAQWPAVNCHQLYENDLLVNPIKLENGFAKVPDGPGLGLELNREALNKFKVNKPKSRPEPARLIETVFEDGTKMYTANDGKVNFMLTAGNEGKYGYYKKGADSKLVPNDGSAKWKELYNKARNNGGPIKG